MTELYFGIDLGTTNSVIAVATADRKDENSIGTIKVLDTKRITGLAFNSNQPETASKNILPSCVYYREKMDKSGYDAIVGEFAKSQYEVRPDYVAKSVKSQMGQPVLSGLSDSIPDKTPEDVSARVLTAMLSSIKRTMNYDIHDAIITVPASFGVAQTEATLRAAKKAGICTVNSDGSKRDILIYEPEAVIYNLINEMQDNPLISDFVLDSSKKLNVIVFDIGGGTLDITFHQVERSKVNDNHFVVDNIATNRYTQLAGDNFDRAIAEEMFNRYLNKVMPEARGEIQANKDYYILKLMSSAEILKMDINNAINDDDNDLNDLWNFGDEDIEEKFFDVSGLTKDKYSYYDKFKKCEVEKILEKYMGNEFSYNDFERLDDIIKADKCENIIYPVLYVLNLAAKNLGTNDFKVDAVILNGGMSKFYMIKNRLEKFFGLKPLCVTDPDLSVARGAAIYRFYQRNNMEFARNAEPVEIDTTIARPSIYSEPAAKKYVQPDDEHLSGIYSGKIINNQPLYISSTFGNKIPIIKIGEELPYSTPRMPGFTIAKNQNIISLPICEKDEKGNYHTIAVGEGQCKQLPYDTYVSVIFSLSKNKILTFNGVRTEDEAGLVPIENISIKINFNTNVTAAKGSNRLQVPVGSNIDVANVLNGLKSLFTSKKRDQNRLKQIKSQIIACSNKSDFAAPIINALKAHENADYNLCLLNISRRIHASWSPSENAALKRICYDIIKTSNSLQRISGIQLKGTRVNIMTAAIYMLSDFELDDTIIKELDEIKMQKGFFHPCMYLFARKQIKEDWIVKEFYNSLKTNKYVQQLTWAVGVLLRRTDKTIFFNDMNKVVENIIKVVYMQNPNTINVGIMALGLICDQRTAAVDKVSEETATMALSLLENLSYELSGRPSYVTARKLISGFSLDKVEEQYLLGYIYTDLLDEN